LFLILNKRKRAELRPVSLLLLFFFADANDLAALVVPAFRANRMGQAHLTTIAALYDIGGLQKILRAAAVTATL
jgi:hypothetical protein